MNTYTDIRVEVGEMQAVQEACWSHDTWALLACSLTVKKLDNQCVVCVDVLWGLTCALCVISKEPDLALY